MPVALLQETEVQGQDCVSVGKKENVTASCKDGGGQMRSASKLTHFDSRPQGSKKAGQVGSGHSGTERDRWRLGAQQFPVMYPLGCP